MIKNESCLLKYHSFYDEQYKEMKIDPLHFFENKGGIYILSKKTETNEIRTLAVERIIDIQGTQRNFNYPEDIKPEKILDSLFDIIADKQFYVQVWFSKNQARYIKERSWSCTQKITENKDGSIIISMTTSGWLDIKRWILSYGADAKVLKPQKMIDEIIIDAKNIIQCYKQK